MKTYQTDQEKFWAGEFGDQYIGRNKNQALLASNISVFSRILPHMAPISSVIELGSNIGLNLMAIQQLQPGIKVAGVEINKQAVEEMRKQPGWKVYHDSILDFKPDYQRDLAFVKGVMIHINPDKLQAVYRLLYDLSKRYICITEYYNPSPVEIPYRGHRERLFKRDFAGEMLDKFKDLRLLSYGFLYHRDPIFPQDDITWFLLEKIKN